MVYVNKKENSDCDIWIYRRAKFREFGFVNWIEQETQAATGSRKAVDARQVLRQSETAWSCRFKTVVPSNGCFDDVWWPLDDLVLVWKMTYLFCFDVSRLERGEDTFDWSKYVWLALDSYLKNGSSFMDYIDLICKRQKRRVIKMAFGTLWYSYVQMCEHEGTAWPLIEK